jgi:hypothetical protein
MMIGTAEPDGRPLSEVLGELPRGRAVTVAETLEAVGPRAHGCALLVLALPDAVPLPIPSLSAVLAGAAPAPDLASGRLWRGTRASRSRGGVALPARLVGMLRERVAPLLRRAERLSHPRWEPLAGHQRPLAVVCLYLAVVLLLPIPFFNTPPALCLVLLALGMVQRDGVLVVAGLAGTAMVTLALAWIGSGLWSLAGATTLI